MTASHIGEAERTLKAQLVDLFFICHPIPSSELQSAVAAPMAIQPQLKIVLVTTANHPDPEGGWQTVDALAGTEAMVFAAQRALQA